LPFGCSDDALFKDLTASSCAVAFCIVVNAFSTGWERNDGAELICFLWPCPACGPKPPLDLFEPSSGFVLGCAGLNDSEYFRCSVVAQYSLVEICRSGVCSRVMRPDGLSVPLSSFVADEGMLLCMVKVGMVPGGLGSGMGEHFLYDDSRDNIAKRCKI
jgi:hypothetical protein